MEWFDSNNQKVFIESLQNRLDQITEQKSKLEEEYQAIENLIALHNPVLPPEKKNGVHHPSPRKQKPAQSRKREDGSLTKQDQVIEIAIGIIKATGKPCHTSEVMKEGKAKGITTSSIYTYLSNEVNRASGARLRKMGTGYYDMAGITRTSMTPDEFKAKVAEAKEKASVR